MSDPARTTIILPSAAAWLWRISDARLRRLAIDGALPYRRVARWGAGRPARAYLFEACVARWGEPDPDKLAGLVRIEINQLSSAGPALWELLALRPLVERGDGKQEAP